MNNKRGWSIGGRPFSNEEYKLSEVYRITALSYPGYLNEYNKRFQDEQQRDELLTDHNTKDYSFIKKVFRTSIIFLESVGKMVASIFVGIGKGVANSQKNNQPMRSALSKSNAYSKPKKQKQHKQQKKEEKKEPNPYEKFKGFAIW
jgi:hypothetical protein